MTEAAGHMTDAAGHMTDAAGHMTDAAGHMTDAVMHKAANVPHCNAWSQSSNACLTRKACLQLTVMSLTETNVVCYQLAHTLARTC